MSLPPLVCNTPPPPDQCEDDKEPEDFDINYNLSQDDDEDCNNYDFQTYPNYDMYQTSKSDPLQECSWPPILNNTFENTLVDNLNEESKETEHVTPILNDLNEKLTLDDVTVEDLNLKVTQEQLNPQITHTEKSDTDNSDPDSTSDYTDNPDNKTVLEADIATSGFDFENENSSKLDALNVPSVELNKENLDIKSRLPDEPDDEFDDFTSNLGSKVNETEIDQSIVEDCFEKVLESSLEEELETLGDQVPTLDEFGDFDDFQFVSNSNNALTYVENVENPWVNETQTSDFGDFKANFDDNVVDNINTETHVTMSNVKKSLNVDNQLIDNGDEDDDFGDFDDFKSCADQSTSGEQHECLQQQVAALDFHSPDNENQILDSINNILSSIFNEEISKPESEFVGKLESILNETWGHLVETDVRQPYMVNWNNSLGQKSLLKALCIDSRNILFGPKWHYNMPKYAVNLSTAPLQPQKPVTSPVPQADNQHSQTSSTKETDTWTDPFSSNGQEFTYAEALLLDLEHLMATLDQMAHKHSTLKISELLSHACSNESETPTSERRTTDLEVFENVISSKQDKIYSPPLNVQPIRQINLPDTHIFTPSDSETPRSKTIHNDRGPPVILAQSAMDNENNVCVNPPSPVKDIVNNMESESDYWEFQDFKSISETVKAPVEKHMEEPTAELRAHYEKGNNILPSVSMPHQPHLLQPIKVETSTLTLNWPDPGEVKDTFDDFSGFVSNAPWENAEKSVKTVDTHASEIQMDLSKSIDTANDVIYPKKEENNDDDFETFQSAPIVPQNIQKPKINSTNDTYQPSSSKTLAFDASFSEFGKFNTGDMMTSANDVTLKNNLSNVLDNHSTNVPHVRDSFITNSPIHSIEPPNILQPVPASSSGVTRVPNHTGQILQPLSLESYSQINWPNPGIDLQDLSRFNPVETLPSLKSETSAYSQSKIGSPAHNENSTRNEIPDEDIWGDFVSSKPKQQIPTTKKLPLFGDEDEWTEFVSSPSVKPQNGLNTISLNVHTNSSMSSKSTNLNKLNTKNNQISLDIPTLTYITPKANHKTYSDKHFQNL